MRKICTFIGNKDIFLNNIEKDRLLELIVSAITDYGVTTFYCGNYGKFDLISAEIIKSLKSYFEIRSVFVTPYIDERYLNKEIIKELYDDILYPGLEKTPLKFAIIERNKYMIDHADIVISGVYKQYGNAYKFLNYALSKNKIILPLQI